MSDEEPLWSKIRRLRREISKAVRDLHRLNGVCTRCQKRRASQDRSTCATCRAAYAAADKEKRKHATNRI